MNQLYTRDELDHFETVHQVTLPEAFKTHLQRVGANGRKISLLEDWCQPYPECELPDDFLARPFPHREAWNDLRLLDESPGWSAPYFDRLLWCGALRISNMGCEAYRLLVVSGVERGSIWCDERVRSDGGIFPLLRWGRRVTIEKYLGWTWH